MNKLCLLTIFLFAGIVGINAQDVCPANLVCITPAAARQALEDGDTVKAQKIEIQKLHEAIEGDPGAPANADGTPSAANLGYKGIIADWRVKYAQVFGEYTGFKMGSVRVDVAFDTAIKNTKKRCLPLSVCF